MCVWQGRVRERERNICRWREGAPSETKWKRSQKPISLNAVVSNELSLIQMFSARKKHFAFTKQESILMDSI